MTELKQRLYYVTTTAKKFSDCKNVTFNWFRAEAPAERRRYASLIEGYEPGNAYAEGLIDELFTEDEALQLKEYLDQVHGKEGPTLIEEMSLPIPNNMMGHGARAVGGGDDFYMLSEDPEYSLPFKVWGYFNVVGCTLIDNGDTHRHRLFIVRRDPSGKVKVRKETNAEAAARERRQDAIARDSDCPF